MKKSKVVQLLQSCDSTEIMRIDAFLASPYFNQEERIHRLFQCLQSFYPDFPDADFSKKAVFQQVFPDQPYNDKQLRYLLSALNKKIEMFVAYEKIAQQPHQLMLALLQSLSERGLDKAYKQINLSISKELSDMKSQNSDFFLAQLQWSEIQERHFQRQRLRKFDLSLQHFADDLDKFYFLHRLKITCGMLDRQAIFQSDYQLNISEEWIRHIEQQHCFHEPLIEAYYIIFRALLQQEEEHYFIQLKAFLKEHSPAIAKKECKDIYLFAINYCARKIREGKGNYTEEALQLYRSGIETGLLIDEHGLSPWAFTNVVKLALRLQYYNWIESFIYTYAPSLPEAFRKNAVHYNLAELYYYTRHFEQAQQHLNEVAFSDLNYYLGTRILLAKIFYETDEKEALLSLLSSFTIFLKRNKELSGDLKHTYLNFCQILFQIVRRSSSRMQKLKETIKDTRLLTDRTWLETIYEQALSSKKNI